MSSGACKDLQITVLTENGDYSVSTNDTFARVLYDYGLQTTTRRVFPSNIKGAPSRYFIRTGSSAKMALRSDSDLALILIEDLADRVLSRLREGGLVIYDPGSSAGEKIDAALESNNSSSIFYRDSVNYCSVPLKQLAGDNFEDYRMKRVMRNVIYVGFLSYLFGLPAAEVNDGFAENFADKGEKIVDNNLKALKLGRDYAENLNSLTDEFQLNRSRCERDTLFMRGNDATALGAVMGGCTYASWYPITPATSHGENLERYAQRYPLVVEQGENEDSCLGRALGASWAGARASVSTSGPGFSNMAEFVGYSSFTEIPVVIFNIQRCGPSTGMPTHTKQGDLRAALHISHDESPRVVLTPSTVEQLYSYSWQAFNIAARYQMPVILLSDLELGLSHFTTEKLDYPDEPVDEGKVLSPAELEELEEYSRYEDVDGDGVCPRTLPGQGPPYVTRGAYHTPEARLSEAPEDAREKMERLFKKMTTMKENNDLPAPEVEICNSAGAGAIVFGSTRYAFEEAREKLTTEGIELSLFDLPALSPFPTEELHEFFNQHEKIFIIEQNYSGQLMSLIQEKVGHDYDFQSLRSYDGRYMNASIIEERVKESLLNERK